MLNFTPPDFLISVLRPHSATLPPKKKKDADVILRRFCAWNVDGRGRVGLSCRGGRVSAFASSFLRTGCTRPWRMVQWWAGVVARAARAKHSSGCAHLAPALTSLPYSAVRSPPFLQHPRTGMRLTIFFRLPLWPQRQTANAVSEPDRNHLLTPSPADPHLYFGPAGQALAALLSAVLLTPAYRGVEGLPV